MRLADGRPAIQQPEAIADALRQRILGPCDAVKSAVDQHPEIARRDFRNRFVNRDHPADVQRRVSIVIIRREQLELRVKHGQFARVIVELDLAEQRDFLPRRQQLGEVFAVKPFSFEYRARWVSKGCFEQAEITASKACEPRGSHFRHHRRHFAGRKLCDGFHVAAIFVTEGNVGEQVLHRHEFRVLRQAEISR